MNNHPVLSLLAKEEEPPYRVLQKTAALVAESPDVLLDLMGQDLSDNLLGLLETRNARFSRILLEVGGKIRNKDKYSLKLTRFVICLVRSTKDILSQGKYCDLLNAALQSCLNSRNRWQLVKEIAVKDQTMEQLILSTQKQSMLLQWFLDITEDGVDALALNDWTHRVVALVDACSADHHVSATLNSWRKIQSLCETLRKAIDGDVDPTQASEKSRSSSLHLKNTVIDDHTSLLFLDFNLPIPQSQGLYRHHLDVLSHRETLLILKNLLKSYPCGLCQRTGHSDATLLKWTAPKALTHDVRSAAKRTINRKATAEWLHDLTETKSGRALHHITKSPSTAILKLHNGVEIWVGALLVQMRTQKIGLNDFLFHFNVPEIESPRCPCGYANQTVKHVLMECSFYEGLRERTWREERRVEEGVIIENFRTLLTTPRFARKAAYFMSNTGLIGQLKDLPQRQKD